MNKYRQKNNSAFTLVELLVVIAIIGLLVTLSVLALSNARLKSRDAKRVADVKQIQSALELFYDTNDRYPANLEFRSGAISSTSLSTGTTTYMGTIPTAPTPADGGCSDNQNNYRYNVSSDGSSYTLDFCLGSNAGSGANAQCATSAGMVSGGCGPLLTAMLYGKTGSESGSGIMDDDNYIYAIGSSDSGPATGTDAVISKYDKRTLSLVASKMYGGNSSDDFNKIVSDGEYLYVSGGTLSEGPAPRDSIIYKFDKDLNIKARKVFGTSATANEYFRPLAVDANYVYVLGQGYSNSKYDADIVKFNKNDLSLVAAKIYGADPADNNSYMQMATDDNYIYASGNFQTAGFGGYDVLVTKFNKNDLSIVASKIIGSVYDDSSSNDRLLVDDQYLYVPFYSLAKTAGANYDAGLLKLNKNDLSLGTTDQILCGGSNNDQSGRITFSGNYIYWHISTKSEGQGDFDYGLVKIDKNLNLPPTYQKVLGSSGTDSGNGLVYSDGYYYLHGTQPSGGAGGNDFALLKFKDLPIGTYNTSPARLVLADGSLSCQFAGLSIMDSNLTYQNLALSVATSTLTEKIPTWITSGPFIIQ